MLYTFKAIQRGQVAVEKRVSVGAMFCELRDLKVYWLARPLRKY